MNKQTETELDAVSSYPVGYFEWQKEIDKIELLRSPRARPPRARAAWHKLREERDQLLTR